MTDTYVLEAFTVMQVRSIRYFEMTTTDEVAEAAKKALLAGADYISIRRIRHE